MPNEKQKTDRIWLATIGLLALVVAATIAGVATWFLTPKVAYVESAKLVDGFTETVKARKVVDEKKAAWEQELKQLEDSLGATVEKMKTAYEQAGPTRRKELDEELKKRNGDLARYGEAVQQKAAQAEQQVMGEVVNKIDAFLAVWGEQHGYDLIMGTMAGGNIVYADKRMDVTVEVLGDLNEHYSK